jgi:hypothetical protein
MVVSRIIGRPKSVARTRLAVTSNSSESKTRACEHGDTGRLDAFPNSTLLSAFRLTGTKVRLRITHRGATFAALGYVAHASASEGMGIAFGEIKARDRAILDAWLGEHYEGSGRCHKTTKQAEIAGRCCDLLFRFQVSYLNRSSVEMAGYATAFALHVL